MADKNVQMTDLSALMCLVVQQPFADLIASGEKRIENRTWATKHRGLLGIVAGKGDRYVTKEALASMRTGCVVAIVELVDCIPLANVSNDRYAEGPWCWMLANIQAVANGRNVRGMPGLFRFRSGDVE